MKEDYSKYADFLSTKFYNKENLKKIDDQKIKLTYYNLFFDSYQEMFSDKNSFYLVNDINVYLDDKINVFMINFDDKKIIFETPHYSIINRDYPSGDWELLKLR